MKKLITIILSLIIFITPTVAYADIYISIDEAAEVVYDKMLKREKDIYLPVRHNNNDFQDVCNQILDKAIDINRPGERVYWVWSDCFYKEKNINGVDCIWFDVQYRTSINEEKETDNYVSYISNQLNLYSGSDYDKVKKIYKWMTENISYDNTSSCSYTAYGAINGKAVCSGYVMLFCKFCKEASLTTYIIEGNNHAWNIVNIDGLYYQLDATWDRGKSENEWQYFLKANLDRHIPDRDNQRIINNVSMATTDYILNCTETIKTTQFIQAAQSAENTTKKQDKEKPSVMSENTKATVLTSSTTAIETVSETPKETKVLTTNKPELVSADAVLIPTHNIIIICASILCLVCIVVLVSQLRIKNHRFLEKITNSLTFS